jgi:hypothetical protein
MGATGARITKKSEWKLGVGERELALVNNTHRKPLGPIDILEAIKGIRKDKEWETGKHRNIGDILNIDASTVVKLEKLDQLSPAEKKKVQSGWVTIQTMIDLTAAGLSEEKRDKVLERAEGIAKADADKKGGKGKKKKGLAKPPMPKGKPGRSGQAAVPQKAVRKAMEEMAAEDEGGEVAQALDRSGAVNRTITEMIEMVDTYLVDNSIQFLDDLGHNWMEWYTREMETEAFVRWLQQAVCETTDSPPRDAEEKVKVVKGVKGVKGVKTKGVK